VQAIGESHYENFHVASWFCQDLRRIFIHLAYCRVSDDLGDEVGNPEQALRLLDLWERARRLLRRPHASSRLCRAGRNYPRLLHSQGAVADLLVAFRQDQKVTRFDTIDDVLAYCAIGQSVGRLVLYACGESNERTTLSDATCTRCS